MTDLERLAEALDHLHAADIRMNELEAINARQRAELVSARHEAGALRRALDIITRAGDIESARNLALAILERLEGAQPAAIVPLEDVRAADLCELAAARLRRDDARLSDLSLAVRAVVEALARTAIDGERECRTPLE